jgi:peptidoglycan/xylan/chitin deacetylase (PgdA/CDA1 family)
MVPGLLTSSLAAIFHKLLVAKMKKFSLMLVIIGLVIAIVLAGRYIHSSSDKARRNQDVLLKRISAVPDIAAEKQLPLFCRLSSNDNTGAINEVVFTIDDGPYRNINGSTTDHTEIILDILKREKIPATFFLLGCQLDTKLVSTGVTYQCYCQWVKRMFEEDHTVGIHDHKHIQYFKQNRSQLSDSLIYTRNRLKEVSGYDASLYVRSPGGSISPEVATYLKENGYKHVFWNINPETQPHLKPLEILNNIIADLNYGKRGIILMHDRTASAYLPDLIKYLKEHQIKVISLAEWETKYGLPDTVMTPQREKF